MIKTFNSLFVTMFGIGKLKPIPGTFGSLATVIILFICFHKLEINPNLILLGLLVIFIYSFSAVTSHTKDKDNKDPGEIVIDEFIGQSIPIYLYEISHGTNKDPNVANNGAYNVRCHQKRWSTAPCSGRRNPEAGKN